MSNHLDFYKLIPPEDLDKYAQSAGFGSRYPIDLQNFKKVFGGRNKILEVGCGTGRIGQHLISESFNYTGIDTNQEYLDCFNKSLDKSLSYRIENINFLEVQKEQFDIILFPWTVIGDFSKYKQEVVLNKSIKMLNKKGIVLLDNPTKGTIYNSAKGYEPTKFYFDDWKDFFSKLALKKFYRITYTTDTNRVREITALEK